MTDRPEKPTAGFYAVRLRKGAAEVAALVFETRCPMIWPSHEVDPGEWCAPLDRSPRLLGLVDGRLWFHPEDLWTNKSLRSANVWEYRFLIDDRRWARENAPGDAAHDPFRAVDVETIEPVF